jgi:AcrR family transcriptional regulator
MSRAERVKKPTSRTPVQARSRATVEAIIEGTAKVLSERGYAKATTNHIAEAAGVSIGSLYQYFADKDAAVAACIDQYAAETLAFAWAHVDDGVREGRPPVAAWLHAMLERTCEDEALVRVMFFEVPFTWSLPSVTAALAGAVEVVESLAGEALGEGEVRHDRAYVILKSAVAVITDAAADPQLRARRESIVDELARMIDAYLAAL